MGNEFGDDLLTKCITPAVAANYRLKALNLSKTNVTDAAVDGLFKAIRHGNTLTDLALQGNSNLTGSFLATTVGPILAGKLPTVPEDAAVAKDTAKLIADKNKTLKALNTKRKKAGFSAEIPDYETPPSCVTGTTITNKSMKNIDISHNAALDAKQLAVFVSAVTIPVVDGTAIISTPKLVIAAKGATIPPDVKEMLLQEVKKGGEADSLASWRL
jgi:hypothetical protein